MGNMTGATSCCVHILAPFRVIGGILANDFEICTVHYGFEKIDRSLSQSKIYRGLSMKYG